MPNNPALLLSVLRGESSVLTSIMQYLGNPSHS